MRLVYQLLCILLASSAVAWPTISHVPGLSESDSEADSPPVQSSVDWESVTRRKALHSGYAQSAGPQPDKKPKPRRVKGGASFMRTQHDIREPNERLAARINTYGCPAVRFGPVVDIVRSVHADPNAPETYYARFRVFAQQGIGREMTLETVRGRTEFMARGLLQRVHLHEDFGSPTPGAMAFVTEIDQNRCIVGVDFQTRSMSREDARRLIPIYRISIILHFSGCQHRSSEVDEAFEHKFEEHQIGPFKPGTTMLSLEANAPYGRPWSAPQAPPQHLDGRQALTRPRTATFLWSMEGSRPEKNSPVRLRIFYVYKREKGDHVALEELRIHFLSLARELRDMLMALLPENMVSVPGHSVKAYITVLRPDECVYGVDIDSPTRKDQHMYWIAVSNVFRSLGVQQEESRSQNALFEKHEGREIGPGAPSTEIIPAEPLSHRAGELRRALGAQSGALIEDREEPSEIDFELGEAGRQRVRPERRSFANSESPTNLPAKRLARRQVMEPVRLPLWVYNSLDPVGRAKIRMYSSGHNDGRGVFHKVRVHGYFTVREGDEDSSNRRQAAAQALADGLRQYLKQQGFEDGGALFTPWVTVASFDKYYPGVDIVSDPARVPEEHVARWAIALYHAFPRSLYYLSTMGASDVFAYTEAESMQIGPGHPGFRDGAVVSRPATPAPPQRREPSPANGGAGGLAQRQSRVPHDGDLGPEELLGDDDGRPGYNRRKLVPKACDAIIEDPRPDANEKPKPGACLDRRFQLGTGPRLPVVEIVWSENDVDGPARVLRFRAIVRMVPDRDGPQFREWLAEIGQNMVENSRRDVQRAANLDGEILFHGGGGEFTPWVTWLPSGTCLVGVDVQTDPARVQPENFDIYRSLFLRSFPNLGFNVHQGKIDGDAFGVEYEGQRIGPGHTGVDPSANGLPAGQRFVRRQHQAPQRPPDTGNVVLRPLPAVTIVWSRTRDQFGGDVLHFRVYLVRVRRDGEPLERGALMGALVAVGARVRTNLEAGQEAGSNNGFDRGGAVFRPWITVVTRTETVIGFDFTTIPDVVRIDRFEAFREIVRDSFPNDQYVRHIREAGIEEAGEAFEARAGINVVGPGIPGGEPP